MKRTLSSIAAAALVLGTIAPAAFAATANNPYSDISGNFAEQQIVQLTNDGFIHGFSDGTYRPANPVSRGQLLAYFMLAMQQATGVKPVAEAQYYADIPPHNWDFNFVGAAEQAGWLNPYWIGVRPGYNFNENYQASWGDAASFFVAAMEHAGTLTTAQMNGMAPLAWAKANGLFQGIPSSASQVYLDRASAAMFLSNALAWSQGQLLPTGAVVTLNAPSTNLAPNSSENLSVNVKDASGNAITLPSTAAISYSTDSTSAYIVNGNQLVVTQPGTVNVTATVDGVQSKPVAINVFGAMASLKMSAATASPVANNQSGDAVTLTAVDANGNTVSNYNGTATVSLSGSAVNPATSSTTPAQATDVTGPTTSNGVTSYTVQFTNGVGTFNTISGMTPGLTSTVTATYTTPTNSASQTATLNLTSIPQVATKLVVTAPGAYVSANAVTSANFTVEVVDQAGFPMLSGTYPFNIAVSGNGTYSGSTTGVFFGDGSTSPTQTSVPVSTEQGVTGTITVTASATGLQTGSASTQAVIAQAPVKFTASPTSGSSTFVQGSSVTFDLNPVDPNGYPAAWPTGDTFTAYVTNSSGSVASNVYVNNSPEGTNGVGLGTAQSVILTDPTTTAGDAGNYTVTIKDQNGNTWASFPVAETGSTLSKVNLSAAAQYVSEASPSTTVSAQLSDQFGNAADISGVPVTFTLVSGPSGAAFSGGTTSIVAYTNASGLATATLNMLPYGTYVVGASAAYNNTTLTVPSASDVSISVEPTIASTATVSLSGPGGATYVTAGQPVTGWVYVKDQYGNWVTTPQTVTLTVTGGLSITSLGSTNLNGTPVSGSGPFTTSTGVTGAVYIQGVATTQGLASVQATDTSVSPNVSGTGSVVVNANTSQLGGYAFFNASGQEITNLNEVVASANTPVEVWLKPVDSQGNPIVAPVSGTALASDGMTGTAAGSFRVNSNYAASSNIISVPAGTVAIPVYYVNGNSSSTGGAISYDLTSTMLTAFPTNGTSVASSVYSYSATMSAGPNAGGTFSPSAVTVAGYTAAGATPTANTFSVTSAGNGLYTITLYSSLANTNTTALPVVSYNSMPF